MKLFKNSLVIGGFTLASRVLGFLRDMLMAAILGTGPFADAFFAAFRLPNLFRRMFAEGAFNAAFVPLYAGKLETEGEKQADAFARESLSVLLTFLLVLVIGMELAMPWIMRVYVPGFLSDPTLFAHVVLYAQITMPYIVFMSIAAQLAGILNARNKFAAAAAAPILLNVVLIAVLLSRPQEPSTAALHLSIGVAFSGILQVLVVFWGCARLGVKLGLRPPRLSNDVKRLIALGVPGAISAGVVQINLVVAQRFASMQEHATSWLQYADRLYQLPLGMVGVAMGVALLPGLTRQVRSGDEAGARRALNEALELSAAFTLPAATALFVLPQLFVEGLFMRGAFGEIDAINTAAALRVYALGLPAFILIKVFAPAFFARQDTKTPMLFAAASMALNVALCAILFTLMGFVGLAVATTMAGWLNAILLGASLMVQKRFTPSTKLARRMAGLFVASIIMGLAILAAAPHLLAILQALPGSAFIVAVLIACLGMAVYALAALVFGGVKPAEVKAAFGRK